MGLHFAEKASCLPKRLIPLRLCTEVYNYILIWCMHKSQNLVRLFWQWPVTACSKFFPCLFLFVLPGPKFTLPTFCMSIFFLTALKPSAKPSNGPLINYRYKGPFYHHFCTNNKTDLMEIENWGVIGKGLRVKGYGKCKNLFCA